MTILVTGGAGFIGSHFVHHLLHTRADMSVVNVDKLTYAGRLENLADLSSNLRHTFVRGDICDQALMERICREHHAEAIVNFAAESHVDRSIHSGLEFIETDVEGIYTLLNIARDLGMHKFVQVSTDEVYGDIPPGEFSKEIDPLRPSSPYAASKAGGELQCFAFYRTYETPVVVTRSSNNYGPNMYPEKFIPLAVTNVLEGKKIPVYGDGKQRRDWLYVDDHCRAIVAALERGTAGEAYNVGANMDEEVTNLSVAKKILSLLGKDDSWIEHITDRPGHDRRYAVHTGKIRKELGWEPQVPFDEGIAKTVEWYVKNESWWRPIKTGDYLKYYEKQYGREMI